MQCMQKVMIMKLLKHMILDFETVRLVSTDDLIGEAGMSADEVRALKLSDAEWHKYDASSRVRTRDAQRGASNAFPAPTNNSHAKPTGMAACNGGQQVDALLSRSQYPAATGNSNPQNAYQPAPPTAPPSQAASGVDGAAPSAGGRGGAFANPSVTSSGTCLSFSAVRKTAIAYASTARQPLQVHPRLQAGKTWFGMGTHGCICGNRKLDVSQFCRFCAGACPRAGSTQRLLGRHLWRRCLLRRGPASCKHKCRRRHLGRRCFLGWRPAFGKPRCRRGFLRRRRLLRRGPTACRHKCFFSAVAESVAEAGRPGCLCFSRTGL